MGMGTDILPALDAMSSQYTGCAEPYIYHFPDGNASVARLLVRSLIPAVARGHTMEDVVLADFDRMSSRNCRMSRKRPSHSA